MEDEKHMAEALEQVLKKNRISVDLAYDGEQGLDCGLTGIYDIVVLDIMLPRLDGISVLKKMRSSGVATPVILLSAKGEIEDKVRGLDSGADDYLAKPFQTVELLARLRALSRRRGELVSDNCIIFEDLEFNLLTYDLWCREKSFRLTLKEGQLLELFMNNRKRVLSTGMIIERLWGFETETEDRHVQVYVSFLRKKLTQLGSVVRIKVMRGVGYVLAIEGEN